MAVSRPANSFGIDSLLATLVAAASVLAVNLHKVHQSLSMLYSFETHQSTRRDTTQFSRGTILSICVLLAAIYLGAKEEDVVQHLFSDVLWWQDIDIWIFDPPFRMTDPRPLGILFIFIFVNLAPTLGRSGPAAVQTNNSRSGH